MKRKMTMDDADAFLRQLKWWIAGIVGLVVVPLLIYTVYLDRRLDAFTATLQHRSPQHLETHDLVDDDVHHQPANPVQGQVIYVPAYSHIYHGKGNPQLLTITLSVRNTDTDDEIIVKSVRYFDTTGNEVKSYLKKPVRLPALATTEIIVERDDATGGSGANFLVEWFAPRPVTEPMVEAVMIDTNSQQGISFARRGTVISHVVPRPADSERNGSSPSSADSDETDNVSPAAPSE